jgi:hypothetical protein
MASRRSDQRPASLSRGPLPAGSRPILRPSGGRDPASGTRQGRQWEGWATTANDSVWQPSINPSKRQ